MKLNYFDCNCSIGRFAVPQPQSFFTADELIAEMDYAGVDQALVYHTWSREYSPAEGNTLLMKEITGFERLVPCWGVMPHHTGEMPAPDQLVAMIIAQGVRAVRIFPGVIYQNWFVKEWSAKPLLSELANLHIPLFISFNQIPWDDLYTLGKAYPRLPIVVTEVRYEESRNFYPLLEQLPNMHIDLCMTIIHLGLETEVKRFGAARFLFGSRMPIYSAGPSICYLQYAGISDEDKMLIAGNNLRRLLGWYEDSGANKGR
jgi:hypothetical protein